MPFAYRTVCYPATATTEPCVRILGIYTDDLGRIIGSTQPEVPAGNDVPELTRHLLAMGEALTLPTLAFESVYAAVYAPAPWLAVSKAARA